MNETGGTSLPAADSTGGWELEESLDVEWAHAMAPGATITLVEATTPNSNDLLAAVSYAAAHANVVSMSWGSGEFSGESSYDSDFSHAGVAFVASSGDSGAPIEWPAASPNVLAVGGTALTLGANNAWSSETGWSGSGGGPSAYESQPSYQSGVVTATTMRANPDVAYDASPNTGFAVYDSDPYSGTSYGWLTVGGTSAGAPQWAAILAIADQGRAAASQPALDSSSAQEVMTILYKNPGDFHDITTGTSTGSPNYTAGPGYDYVTGLGSPMVNLVVGSLDGTTTTAPDSLVVSVPSTATAGTSFSFTVTADTSGGAVDTGYTGTIHFTSTDGQAALPGNYTFTAADKGSHTFTVTLKTAGTETITATDTRRRPSWAPPRGSRSAPARRPSSSSPAFSSVTAGVVPGPHGHREGCLRQRGDRIYRHRAIQQQRHRGQPAGQLHVPRVRRRLAYVRHHVRDRRLAVSHRHGHDLEFLRHPVGDQRRPGRPAQPVRHGGLDVPDQPRLDGFGRRDRLHGPDQPQWRFHLDPARHRGRRDHELPGYGPVGGHDVRVPRLCHRRQPHLGGQQRRHRDDHRHCGDGRHHLGQYLYPRGERVQLGVVRAGHEVHQHHRRRGDGSPLLQADLDGRLYARRPSLVLDRDLAGDGHVQPTKRPPAGSR